MIVVDALSKYFGNFQAVNNISFSIDEGEVVGFLGPNGAGKSTTMKMITGFLTPDEGDVFVNNLSIMKSDLEIKKNIGYLPEGAPCYGDMTVDNFLKFIADVRKLKGSLKKERLNYVTDVLELTSVLHKSINQLSKGYKRRVGLAQAIIHDPKILILDEPTDGLDPVQKFQVRELIKGLAKNKIVIISTHILEEVTAVCSRAIIIADGQLKVDTTPSKLLAMSDYYNAITVNTSQPGVFKSIFDSHESIAKVILHNDSVTLVPQDKQSNIYEVVQAVCEEKNMQYTSLSYEKGNLEEVFRKIVA